VSSSPAGLYVHLPYCASRCGYCSFVVTTDASSRGAYFDALAREAALLEAEAGEALFDSVYLGGGTPSLAPPDRIAGLTATLRAKFHLAADSEVTLEANPEDVTPDRAAAWRTAGVNRVSVGVQSLVDRELEAVGRRHDAARAETAVATALEAGFSVSADLILGLPEQTAESFRRSAAGVAAAGVGHVSVYLLEPEKSKIIQADRHLKPERYLTDDAQADLWLELDRTLEERGLRHYEISNWALAGREARHNLKYWTRTPTLGLGVSAHEFWSGRRRANVSGIPAYIEALESGNRPVALDRPVDALEAGRERIVLGLRLAEGVAAGEIEAWIRGSGDRLLEGDYGLWISEGLLARRGDRVAFTARGFLISNDILCRFV
jgi:putative oxygen-independent coproporphyrinogen III oxidase